jgi:predicted phosphodiesterase
MKKTTTKKTLAHFEETHGQPKISRLQKALEAEHAKVEALAGTQNRITVETRRDCKIRFAIIGDTHIGSLYAHTDAIRAFYEYAAKSGCEAVYHAGDILDGHRVYRGQEFELRDVGLDAQLDRLEGLDMADVKTRFITGNHDQSFKTAAGIHVGKSIESTRTGWEFLGEEQATVEWQTPAGRFSMMLSHPGGGTSYAQSYRIQKQIESLSGGTKPDLLVNGHYHKALFMPSYRNVCGVMSGTFQKQTPFMARQGLAAHVGGWIIDVTVGEDHNAVKGEFVAFYV